jgi:hypothetical protein
MFVPEWHPVKPQESEHLEAIAVVIGNAKQFRIGIEGDHCISCPYRKPETADRDRESADTRSR